MNANDSSKLKLCACTVGFAIGVVNALYMMLFAWGAWFFGYDATLIHQVGHIFYGYAPTMLGGVYGAAWGFVDGFVFGFVAAWIYNLCLCCRCKKS